MTAAPKSGPMALQGAAAGMTRRPAGRLLRCPQSRSVASGACRPATVAWPRSASHSCWQQPNQPEPVGPTAS
eukprot:7832655-Alexandrium_andersonii.AAC.1